MTSLRRYRLVDAFNQGIDKLVVQIDPVLDYNAEVVIPVDVTGTPWGSVANPLNSVELSYTQLLEYDGSNNLLYHGRAAPGSASSAAAWQIKQFIYSGANITAIKFAAGTAAFTAIWDNRAGLSYS